MFVVFAVVLVLVLVGLVLVVVFVGTVMGLVFLIQALVRLPSIEVLDMLYRLGEMLL